MKKRLGLLDIVGEYGGQPVDTRVVKYAEDGRTPLIIERTTIDDEGTTWITQQNLETGETHFRHIPADR